MPFMAVVAVLAGVAAFLMRPFYRWANAMSMPGHTGHFVFGWLRAILSFWSIQTWLPIVAVCAAGILLVLWVVLLVDSEATMVVVTLSSIALAAGSLGCLPFLIALAVGIACAVIYALVMIVIGIVVMLLLGAILWGLMNQ
jgi:hypothetical protein